VRLLPLFPDPLTPAPYSAFRQARPFSAAVRPELLVDSASLAEILRKGDVVLIDSRTIDWARGATKHELAGRGGAIPGSMNIPWGAFFMENGFLKSPAELLWMLATYGITPDKTVITTCDTGIGAANTFYILRYLGFADLRVHGEAWVIWSNIVDTESL
jgi:thiosulfate/3-mercaptopyruvate sulfurtransferase